MKRKKYYVVIGYGKMGKAVMDAINIKKGKKTYVLILDKNIDEYGKDQDVLKYVYNFIKKTIIQKFFINKINNSYNLYNIIKF